MTRTRHRQLGAFTIIEMAIVLTIVGLIIGGILGGQALLRAGATNGVMRDMSKAKISVAAFYDKYNGLPGDIANATLYWGAAGGNATDNYTTTCYSNAGTGTQTCNGNNDGKIGSSNTDYEVYRAWQQLSNAGFWAGTFSGLRSIATGQTVAGDNPGSNLPMGRYLEGGRQATYKIWYATTDRFYDGTTTGNYLEIAGNGAGMNGGPPPYIDTGAILSNDAYSIDRKVDDGLPAFGALQVNLINWSGCATTGVASTAAYSIAETAAVTTCSLFYDMGIKS